MKVHIGKYFTGAVPINNNTRRGDSLPLLHLNLALKYAIRKGKKSGEVEIE
jgi:hypothetical protein